MSTSKIYPKKCLFIIVITVHPENFLKTLTEVIKKNIKISQQQNQCTNANDNTLFCSPELKKTSLSITKTKKFFKAGTTRLSQC